MPLKHFSSLLQQWPAEYKHGFPEGTQHLESLPQIWGSQHALSEPQYSPL
jgi:hypothetical protein